MGHFQLWITHSSPELCERGQPKLLCVLGATPVIAHLYLCSSHANEGWSFFVCRPARFLCVVRANLFGNAQAVHSGMEQLSITYQTPEGKEAGTKLLSAPTDGNLDPSEFPTYLKCFSDMWVDGGVQEAMSRANEFQLNDSSEYFWKRADVILQPDYIPNDDDVLRSRVRTTGIVSQNFSIKEQKYTVFDVGGQRNERRKWIHCFDNVTAVIFVTAISEFDQARRSVL